MSSELGLYTRTGGKTHTCSTCDGCDLKDYTGSYHISISLPHDPEGCILYDEEALQDSSTCADDYTREARHAGETQTSVWVEAHMVTVLELCIVFRRELRPEKIDDRVFSLMFRATAL